LKILLTHDGTDQGTAAVRDFQRAGLPRNGKALVLAARRTEKAEKATPGLETVEAAIQTLLPDWEVTVEQASPLDAESVLRAATWWSPDLIVLGCRKSPESPSDLVAFDIVHRARCSVRMVTPPAAANIGPIRLLLADDGSPGAQSAARMVERRSWPADTHVRLLAIGRDTQSVSREALLDRGLNVCAIRVEGDPCQALVREAEAWNSDVVFIGAHGKSSANRFLLGSVSTAVVTRLRRTIEVVR